MLEGKIERQGLVDIIQLLATSRKSGVLRVTGDVTGDIYFSDGEIINAKVNGVSGEEAFYEIFILVKGKFSFVEKEPDVERKILKTLTDLLLEASAKLQEWEKVKHYIPYDDASLALVPMAPEEEETLNLSAEEWKVLSQIDGRRSIKDIAKLMNLPKTKVQILVAELNKKGMVESEDEKSAKLKILFKKIAGAILKLIIRKLSDKEIKKFVESFNKWLYAQNIPLHIESCELKDESGVKTPVEKKAENYLISIKKLISEAQKVCEKEEILLFFADLKERFTEEERKLLSKYKFDVIFLKGERKEDVEVWEQEIKKIEEKGLEGGGFGF